jgi:hypothetical protein
LLYINNTTDGLPKEQGLGSLGLDFGRQLLSCCYCVYREKKEKVHTRSKCFKMRGTDKHQHNVISNTVMKEAIMVIR